MKAQTTDHKGEIVLSIPSEDKYIYLLDLVVSYAAKEMHFDEETAEQVNLAVIEAGTNAIKHGNKNDPEKAAEFRFRPRGDGLPPHECARRDSSLSLGSPGTGQP